jgi:crotonobetainyl-CoA:carnitine CoA-transferase CaiB-like acyl-CoA transferase
VLDVKQMHANEQTRARAMVVETEHAALGTVETIGLPVKFSATPGGIARAAPVYGEHTREVLREHGFADGEIDAMARAGAVHLGGIKVVAE